MGVRSVSVEAEVEKATNERVRSKVYISSRVYRMIRELI
jgi:hypothetical protein